MSDFALVWVTTAGAADLSYAAITDTANDLVIDDGLQTATLISLFCDRRAEPGDVLPEGQTDRRGWWADQFHDDPTDKIGSRLWLLDRSSRLQSVLDRAVDYAQEALAWLVDDKVVTRVDVAAEWLTAPHSGYGLAITYHRPGIDPTVYRFGKAWEAEEARA